MEKPTITYSTKISDLGPLYKYPSLQDYQPSQNDIIGAEFNPPYRFIFENQLFTEKEQNLIDQVKTTDYYQTLDKHYWNDAMLLRIIQGCYYDLANTKTGILTHETWRHANVHGTIPDDTLILLVF